MPMKYNWLELEKKIGKTLESIYFNTKSARETGKIFGKPIGLKQGISGSAVLTELHHREYKVNTKGGANFKGNGVVTECYKKIIALPDLSKLKRVQICELTGITDSQFYMTWYKKPFNYNKRRNINFNYYINKYKCETLDEMFLLLWNKYFNTSAVAKQLNVSENCAYLHLRKLGVYNEGRKANKFKIKAIK